MSIFISLNAASRELEETPIYRAVIALAARVMRIRQSRALPAGPGLDITFMLPGAYERPPFEGMRMGCFERSDNLLHFEVAVPHHLIDSTKTSEYVTMVILDAIDHAGYYFLDSCAEAGIGFEPEAWHRAVISLLSPANDEALAIKEVCHV